MTPGSWAARSATAYWSGRPPTSTSRWRATRRRRPARSRARPAASRSSCRAPSGRGAWWAGARPGTSTSCACATTTSADLGARDFTINAMAEPLAGGELLDPHGGREDLAARRLRMVSPAALSDDPLRTLRAARLAVELELELELETRAAVREHAPGLAAVAPERVFAELKR